MKRNVALIFVFNHRYDKNITILEKIYRERFTHIYYLVPFYDGDKPNVIPVYENSFYFQGYLSQGYKQYFGEKYEHFFFVADDLILNPSINENNYKEYFGLPEEASYIPGIFHLHNLANNNTLRFLAINNIQGKFTKWHWTRIKEAIPYRHGIYGAENTNEMPSYSEAEAILNSHGYRPQPLSYKDVYGGLFPLSATTDEKRKQLLRYLFYLRSYFKKFTLAYPLVASYSDILIVSASSMNKFIHYCGVFAVNRLFVEFAIPTALLLASAKVVTETDIGRKGDIYWTYTPAEATKYEQAMQPYHYDLGNLLLNFPKDRLYIHPVKLSKWKTDQL